MNEVHLGKMKYRATKMHAWNNPYKVFLDQDGANLVWHSSSGIEHIFDIQKASSSILHSSTQGSYLGGR